MFIKLLALGTVGAFLAVILKKYSRESVIFFETAVVIAAFFIIKDGLSESMSRFSDIFSAHGGGSEVFAVVLKASAVTVLAKLGSEVCRESGNGLMGDVVELGGRVMLVVLALPFIEKVTEIALSFVK